MANLDKLALPLSHALEVWRLRSAVMKEMADQEITVDVTHTGDVAELQRAGLRTGRDENGKVSGVIAFKDVERLAAVPGVVHVSMHETPRMALDETVPEMRVPWKVPPGFSGRGTGVIVAVIDTGIDIFHESFQTSGGQTRILEMWDQSPGLTGGGGPPTGLAPLGRVYNAGHINTAIGARTFESVDTIGHGTHVAGIAAGNGRQDDRCSFPGRYVGVAPEADLVIVKAIGLGTAPVNLPDAITWCAQAGARNQRNGANRPVVINCSFGHALHAHDSNADLDAGVDAVLRPGGGPAPAALAVVAAAGNEGYGDTHESGTVQPTGQPGATATISFQMPDNSTAPDPMEIWYDGVGSINVTLTAPASTSFPPPNAAGPFAPGAANQSLPIGGMSITTTSAAAPDPSHGNRKQIRISISTTIANARIRDGVWTLTLTNTAAAAANYDIWFQFDNSDGFPRFRLDSDSGDPPVRRRNNTVLTPGMSRNSITVAAYRGDEIASFSSRGPTAFPGVPSGEVKPTIAAVGVAVTASRGRNDPDVPSSCCDQKVVDKEGTSMASPHVAGLVALMFEKNRLLTFEQVRGHLQHSARQDGIPAAEVPPIIDPLVNIRWNNLWGAGKVNAQAALAEMPAAGDAGGGGGGPTITIDEESWGFTPHTIFSRLGDWRRRLGPRPGLMLAASLVSEHVDEILRLVNRNKRVGAVWQRNGGPVLVRHLLHGSGAPTTILPERVQRYDVDGMIPRFLLILSRFGSARLKADIERFGAFVKLWPRADLSVLDEHALRLAESP